MGCLQGCSDCCPAFRPRYKRLVDNIYPRDPSDGLVRSNMEKLTFYADKQPEKLDRISEYLYQRIARDLSRQRIGLVMVGVDAMDIILNMCHAKNLNLFVESFLKTVQLLLESQDPTMQLLATQSFVKYSNIKEDTPSYHRRYDFFVSKFSSLCHSGEQDMETRTRLRLAGLAGLKGVIRKTVSDDLQINIWDAVHMDKIVPSLLFNMQCVPVAPALGKQPAVGSPSAEVPAQEAEACLRELMGRATFGHITTVVKPVLKHLDNHHLWHARFPNEFPVHIFKVIMNSIAAQHSYEVIQILMVHLDEKSKVSSSSGRYASPPSLEETRVRIGIVKVLSNIVAIAAAESIGPSVLEIINSLLNHLRNSISYNSQKSHRRSHSHHSRHSTRYDDSDEEANEEEKQFQEAVINTLGEFADNLPDFQKIEIMMFIIGKVPPPTAEISPADIHLQYILLKSLLKVSTKYKTRSMSHAFPSEFLSQLLSMSLTADSTARLIVQKIFHQLLDRHENIARVERPITLREPRPLVIEEPEPRSHRQDLMFMKKHGQELLLHIYESAQISNNTMDNYNALFTTMVLICVEMSSEDVLTDLLRLTFALQDYAMSSTELNPINKAHIHGLVAGFLHFTSHLTAVRALGDHTALVIKNRFDKSPWLLPDEPPLEDPSYKKKKGSIPKSHENLMEEGLLFDKNMVAEALRNYGRDSGRLLQPFVLRTHHVLRKSLSEINNISVEIDSANSSPGIARKYPEEEITFESFRKILTEPLPSQQEERESRRLRVLSRFKTAPFQDLVNKPRRRTNELQICLNDIFAKIPLTESYKTAISALDEDPVNESYSDDDEEMEELEILTKEGSGQKPVNGYDERDVQRGKHPQTNKTDHEKIANHLNSDKPSDKSEQVAEEEKNPFKDICNIRVDPQQPPLFALQFPDLFVC